MSKLPPAPETAFDATPKPAPEGPAKPEKPTAKVPEIGGPPGPEPTRYGDWQINGRVSDF